MSIERELPRLLQDAGIATAEQAERLANGIAEVLAAESAYYGATAATMRDQVHTGQAGIS